MPSGEVSATASWWPLRNEAEVELARSEIYNDPNGRHAVQIGWGWNADGSDLLQFTVTIAPGIVTPTVALGQVLTCTGTLWEVLSVEQAQARGMTIDDLPPT